MTSSSRPEPEALLAHAAFVHAVARAALAGEDSADDVVQETWLTALRGGPRRRTALKPWLAGVARRQAANLIRRRASQRRRDRRAARPEGVSSTSEVATRAETGRKLVDAVLSLDAMYRDALLLRFYDNLRPKEIAAQLGVPASTVRTRISRGLESLRTRLGETYEEDCGGWSAALLPLLVEPGMGVGATAAVAVGEMIMAKKIAVALVVLVLAGGSVLWLQRPAGEHSRPASAERTALVVVPAHTPPARQEPRPAAKQEPSAVSARPAPVLVGRPPSEPAEAQPVEVEKPKPVPFASGRVVDHEGSPLAGVLVLARCLWDTPSGPRDDWVVPDVEARAALASTAEDGTFAVQDVPDRFSCLAFVKPGKVTREVRDLAKDRAENQNLLVLLENGRRLEGSVRDTDGRPIPGARVSYSEKRPAAWMNLHTYSDSDGRFLFTSLSDLPGILGADALGYRSREPSRRLPATARREDFTIPRYYLIVHVTDAVTGALLGGAGGVVHDRTGGKVIDFLRPPRAPRTYRSVPYLVSARWPLGRGTKVGEATIFAPGYVPVTVRIDGRGSAEPPHVAVALQPGVAEAVLTGRILGTPGARLEIRAPRSALFGPDEEARLGLLQRTDAGPDGAFAFRGLPSGRYRLVVHAPGRGSLGLNVEVPRSALTLKLEQTATLEVRAVSAAGKPVPGAWLTVQPREYHRRWYVQTDPDGLARVEGLTAGKVDIIPERLNHRNIVTRHYFRVETALKPGEAGLTEVLVPDLVPTVFHVRDATGQPARGFAMRLIGMGHSMRVEVHKRVMALKLTTDDNGRATVELYPGRYRIRPATAKVLELETEFFVPVRPGSPVEVVVPSGTGSIFGRVLESGSGRPIPHRRVYVGHLDKRAGWLGVGTTDEEGRYKVIGLPKGRLRVMFSARSKPRGIGIDPESPYPSAQAEVTLRSGGELRVDATVPRVRGPEAAARTIELSLLVRDGQSGDPLKGANAFVEVLIEGIWIGAGEVRSEADGTGRGLLLPGEKYRIVVIGPLDKAASLHYLRARIDAEAVKGRVDVDVDLMRKDESR